ncbi:hypothetical protein [Lysinibacillus sp. NPDC047702]|uniref:hypothetical protein n=1 Tax=Lysinibacillus sp. NPDC047702 TaxID=3390573 RepID=UPI003D07D567
MPAKKYGYLRLSSVNDVMLFVILPTEVKVSSNALLISSNALSIFSEDDFYQSYQ